MNFLYPDLLKITKAFSSATTNLWSQYRFFNLFTIINRIKPKIVYEFGSGVSTVLISAMLRENHRKHGMMGKLYTFEQSPKYYDMLCANLPRELLEYVDLNLVKVRLKWFGDYRGIYYDITKFPAEIDFIYIDGATRTRGCTESDFVYRRCNADIVRIKQQGTSVKLAITDHRYANYPFYVQRLEPKYTVRLSRTWRSIIIKPQDGIAA